MNEVIAQIRQYGVPRDAITVFNNEQLVIVYLLLEHRRLSAEQIECLAADLKDGKERGLFS